jgi:glutathione synthase/RimK-type ligase-like ATP-grasp enzyme
MVLKFAGIRRKSEFSPNHVTNDLQIINLTAEALRTLGAEVALYNEAEITPASVTEDLIFSMVQGPDGTHELMRIAERGALIVNSPESVANCYRINMVPEKGIPFPKSALMNTDGHVHALPIEYGSQKLWIKRGDVHAVHKEDVTLTYTDEERLTILEEFHQRGIERAVLQEHLVGDTVKFYAIRESGFFHWYYLNGVYHTPFTQKRLAELAHASAEVLGLYVFGGDAIIAPDGTITIIDINDWPSFAPIRDAASQHIAQLLYRKAEEYVREYH